ncbi:MAG: serine protease DegS [Alcanivorax sp.]|jgi:serine protease DegS
MKNRLNFITWPAVAGVLAALLILQQWVLPAQQAAHGVHEVGHSFSQAVSLATPSVVNIYTAKLVPTRRNPMLEDLFFRNVPPQQQRLESSLGSGVIMTAQGHILTNNHVIDGAELIQVLLHDGRSAKAVVVGKDVESDLAVLKVELNNLQPIARVDSDQARVGDVVLAIGNPLGFGHSVTQGIVSALGRFGLQLSSYENYIQTDASIHLGNSGGALIDTRGRLLGINTLIYTGANRSQGAATGIGISLAIPSNLAVFVMEDLIAYGEVIRGWLGVSVEPLMMADGIGQALNVTAVSPDSPADRAGILPGDIITYIDNQIVVDGRQTKNRIALLRPGDKINVTIQRRQQTLDLEAVVGILQESPAI